MTAQPTRTRPDPSAQHAEDARYYREILHELIDIGAHLARNLRDEAPTAPPPEEPAEAKRSESNTDRANTFDRLSRAIRRTIALARIVSGQDPDTTARKSTRHRTAARLQIVREVEDVIQRSVSKANEGGYYRELAERLDTPECEDDIANRPIPEIIIEICRDLGLNAPPGTRPWLRRTPKDIATLHAYAARPPRPHPKPNPQPQRPQNRPAAPTRSHPANLIV